MKRASISAETISRDPDGEIDFDQLVQLYRPRIFRYSLAFLRDHDAAETVTQDCFLRAFQSLNSFREECKLQTWLMRIAVNLVRDHVRNRRFHFWKNARVSSVRPLENFIENSGAGDSPEKTLILRQQVGVIWKHADRLPDRQKTVFLLRFVEDMDILEIVAATGMKEGTVKTHLFRALKALRTAVQSDAS